MTPRRLVLCLLLIAGNVNAQKMSSAPDAFLSDINSIAGVAKVGGSLLAADPQKKAWGDYCTASQGFAQQGEFRMAIRTAAKALYLGEKNFGNYGAPVIYASGDIANAYSYAGDHATASLWADRTLALIAKGYESWARPDVIGFTVNSYRVKALALGHAGKYADAVTEMQKGLDALPSFGGGLRRAELLIALASLYTKSGVFDKAGATLGKVAGEAAPHLRVAALRATGDLALAQNDAAAARTHYATALATATTSKDGYRIAMLRLGLARAARLAGDHGTASAELSEALAALEALRSTFSSLDMRTALYGNLQNVFDEAVDFFESRGDPEKAFAASEASRARAMLDLQAKIMPGSAPTAPPSRPRSLGQVQARLATGQTMVVYHQLPTRLIAWVVTSNGFRGYTLPVPAEQLRRDVTRLRAAIEQESNATLSIARSLHQQVIDPLKIPAGTELIMVPHKSMHLLPFQVLHDGNKWLIELNSIATAMSASSFEITPKATGSNKLAAIGNPDLGKIEWALPGAEAEVKAIQALYEQSSVFVLKDASKARLLSISPGADVVHVAAHAVIDEVDPMYSTIKLATAVLPDSPLVSVLSADMEAREFAGLDLRQAGLVTLSACSSGVGKVAEGDEFMGFKRALIAAGARSVLVSLWPVDDESTRLLMVEFHQLWRTSSKSRAMQAAQVKVLSNPKYANPFYWAAFTLVGDPG